MGRAAQTGENQGQWLDNQVASEILEEHADKISGVTTVQLPDGIAQVIKPDGTVVPANWATIVPKPDGGYRTAYPVLPNQ